jgi:dihydrofolate reductase
VSAVAKVHAVITTSIDGYITGRDDGPGKGLGENGERLHNWVFGGEWRYGDEVRRQASGVDAEWLKQATANLGAVVAGRGTYEAARHWGDRNPWGVPFFIVTHRPEEQPDGEDFVFVSGVTAAVERAIGAAGEKDVHVMGGGEIIREALGAGIVDELTMIVAPVVMGGGKRLFDGFTQSLDLKHVGVRQSPYATFIDYAVQR